MSYRTYVIGVSADYLLGIKADKNEERINEYFEKAMVCSHTGEIEKGISIIREALKTYPNNSKLLSVLIGFLFCSFCTNGKKELLEEIVAKAELVLQDSTNEEERIDVLEKLSASVIVHLKPIQNNVYICNQRVGAEF